MSNDASNHPASASAPHVERELKALILELLDENRTMAVATLRPDGWPQATLVGFVRDDLTLYFAVARVSQKLANISRDSRISIAVGHHAKRLRGLSMAAHAEEVTSRTEITRLAGLMRRRYPHQSRFAPRETSTALMRARPIFISIIDLAEGPGEPELVQVGFEASIQRVDDDARGGIGASGLTAGVGSGRTVAVQVRHAAGHVYRPGAPF